MKKGIVLLISLFFIAAISILILVNMKDTEGYINENNSKFNKTQLLFLIKNLQNSISERLASVKEKEEMKEYISRNFLDYIPLNIENIYIMFTLKVYEKLDINKLITGNDEEKSEIESELISSDVFDISVLSELLKNTNVNSRKKFDDILYKYEKYTKNRSIYNISEKIGFIEVKENNLYEITIKIKNLGELVVANYILDENGKVEHFEISFK